jgi:hypothetical protein
MAPEVRRDDFRGAARTWAVRVSEHFFVPNVAESIQDAARKNIFVGLHPATRTVILEFPCMISSQDVKRRMETIFGKGGAMDRCVDDAEAFDCFHAETMGLVQTGPPAVPLPLDEVLEEDEQSSDEDLLQDTGDGGDDLSVVPSSSVPTEVADPCPGLHIVCAMGADDVFSAVMAYEPRKIVIPTARQAMDMDTAEQKELRLALVAAGGPLGKEWEERLFPKNRKKVEAVQNEFRALARMKTSAGSVFWIYAPPSITVYTKHNMTSSRRNEWIRWKLAKYGMEATHVNLMILFNATTHYKDHANRLKYFKIFAAQWDSERGRSFSWKGLSQDVRNLIANISLGQTRCYCSNCSSVIKPGRSDGFCCDGCRAEFCRCGQKRKARLVTDDELDETLVNMQCKLYELASMLLYRSEVEKLSSLHDLADLQEKICDRRRAEKCCGGEDVVVDERWCGTCLAEFGHVSQVQRVYEEIKGGRVTWAHARVAAEKLEDLRRSAIPKKVEKYCEACETARKRRRVG